MINREYIPVSIITYEDKVDEYGQKKITVSNKRTADMVIKIYSQTNVADPRYVDCDYIGITKEKDITDSNNIEFQNIICNIKYIIPTPKYTQVLMKKK